MKKLFEKWKWLAIVYGVLLIVAGVLVAVFSIIDSQNLTSTLSIITAVALFIIGFIALISSVYMEHRKFVSDAIVYATFIIALGVVLCIAPQFLVDFFVLFLGVLLVCFGTVFFFKTFIAIGYREKKSWIISYFIFSAIAIALGAVVLAFKDQSWVKTVIFFILGLGITCAGIVDLIIGIKLYNTAKTISEKAEK